MRSLQGKISEHPPARLLMFLHEQQETGILKLSRQGTSKTLYVVTGAPVNAESTVRDETLGRYLIKSGRISEEDYEKSIALMLSSGMMQGAALVKLGCLKPKELYEAVKSHNREKTLAAFAWTEGEYHFEPEVSFVEDIYRFEFNFYELLVQGTQSYMPLDVIERELARVPPAAAVPAANFQERVATLGLSEAAAKALAKLDGRPTLPALRRAMGEPGAAARWLYLLLLTGLIQPGGRPSREVREVLAEAKPSLPRLEISELTWAETAPEVAEELTVEEKGLKGPEEILSAYMEIKTLDLFAVLGIGRDVGDGEVDAAYRRRMAEFERANFQTALSAEAEAKLEEINTRLIRAYESLKNAAKRKAYQAQLEEASPAKRQQRNLESERCLQEGMKFVRNREFAKAQAMFEKAIQLRPQEPEYYGYLGWTIYMNEKLDTTEREFSALEKIRKAVELNPRLDSPHVFLGKIFKDQGREEEALAEFRQALACNPNCREAKREIQLFEESRRS